MCSDWVEDWVSDNSAQTPTTPRFVHEMWLCAGVRAVFKVRIRNKRKATPQRVLGDG